CQTRPFNTPERPAKKDQPVRAGLKSDNVYGVYRCVEGCHNVNKIIGNSPVNFNGDVPGIE
ncbi:hypothetical protein, partial [Citrobacter freundii]